jgi:hypothetical protein
MSSARPQLASIPVSTSTENGKRRISAKRQPSLFDREENITPGSINDAAMIRTVLAESIKKSGKSRAQIADIMSRLTGSEVTERRLNAYTAESREDFRFPLELARAFCMATRDFALLTHLVEMAGFKVVTKTEFDVLQLGHEYLTHKRAAENMALIERRLAGGDL